MVDVRGMPGAGELGSSQFKEISFIRGEFVTLGKLARSRKAVKTD